MTTTHIYLLTSGFAVSIGALLYTSRVSAAQSVELERLRARQASLLSQEQATLAAARAAQERHRALEVSRSSESTSSASPDSGAMVDAWLARVQGLKTLLAQRPELTIPELVLLTPADWLQVTREETPDDERSLRKTLAALRAAAKDHLVLPLTHGMRKYLDLNNGDLPPSTLALSTYLQSPVSPAILQRYEMIRSGNVKDLSNRTHAVLREKTPIDEEYDMRLQVDGNGVQGRPAGITAWIEGYSERYTRAREEYKRTHNGTTSSDLTLLAPLMQPPLTPTQLEMILRRERERAQR
jgi:hypothetical protein